MHEFLEIAAFPLDNGEILILEEKKIYKFSEIERAGGGMILHQMPHFK